MPQDFVKSVKIKKLGWKRSPLFTSKRKRKLNSTKNWYVKNRKKTFKIDKMTSIRKKNVNKGLIKSFNLTRKSKSTKALKNLRQI